MFKVEKEVPSLELCKRLKKLGFSQRGGGWYWIKNKGKWKLAFFVGKANPYIFSFYDPGQLTIVYRQKDYRRKDDFIKAPTCREILEWIEIAYQKYITDVPPAYTFSEIEPNILAKELIWLAEHKYVGFKKEV